VKNQHQVLEFLRVGEAAQYLNVQESTIRAWLLKRKLPKVRIGDRAVRIPRTALDKLIAENTVPAARD
jgi:excisionase family DNA binding protein